MDILFNDNKLVIFWAYRIESGIYDEPNVEKWALYNAEGKFLYYVLKNGLYKATVGVLPSDIEALKYFYIDGRFVLNPDWTPAPLPIEEQVKELANDVIAVDENLEQVAADMAYIAMCCDIDLDT